MDIDYIKKLLPERIENAHKGTFGHVLNIAGSKFYTGAAYFSSIAALKVGCGLVTLASTESVIKSISAFSPDIIFIPVNNISKKIINNFQAISIGCGLSQERNEIKNFKRIIGILSKLNTPVVIDADGLNILSKIKNIKLPQKTVLTPHPKEMARLMNVSAEQILSQPELWVQKCCEKYNCTTVLKLHKTLIANNKGGLYENSTGNTALSHGGSGDVLCGMITGFLAQGLNLFDACCLGVYLHGLTGELASKDLTEYSALASDLINYIPKTIQAIL